MYNTIMGYKSKTTVTVSILHIPSVSDALVTQHAEQMHPIILSSVACLVLPYFSTLFYEQQDISKKNLLNVKCVLIFSTTIVCNICHSKNMVRHYKCILVCM
jgi:hypothetical protein